MAPNPHITPPISPSKSPDCDESKSSPSNKMINSQQQHSHHSHSNTNTNTRTPPLLAPSAIPASTIFPMPMSAGPIPASAVPPPHSMSFPPFPTNINNRPFPTSMQPPPHIPPHMLPPPAYSWSSPMRSRHLDEEDDDISSFDSLSISSPNISTSTLSTTSTTTSPGGFQRVHMYSMPTTCVLSPNMRPFAHMIVPPGAPYPYMHPSQLSPAYMSYTSAPRDRRGSRQHSRYRDRPRDMHGRSMQEPMHPSPHMHMPMSMPMPMMPMPIPSEKEKHDEQKQTSPMGISPHDINEMKETNSSASTSTVAPRYLTIPSSSSPASISTSTRIPSSPSTSTTTCTSPTHSPSSSIHPSPSRSIPISPSQKHEERKETNHDKSHAVTIQRSRSGSGTTPILSFTRSY